jgi:hypothetical protein
LTGRRGPSRSRLGPEPNQAQRFPVELSHLTEYVDLLHALDDQAVIDSNVIEEARLLAVRGLEGDEGAAVEGSGGDRVHDADVPRGARGLAMGCPLVNLLSVVQSAMTSRNGNDS